MPNQLLPIVDKPRIQYAIEDHFDSNQEREAALRAKGKTKQARHGR